MQRALEFTPPKTEGARPYVRAIFWLLGAEIIVLLLLVWAGSLSLGLVSDDYAHLVQDVHLPFWKGSDHLFRPLRNIFLRDVLAPAFGTTPQPYHILLLALYCATVLSVWWMVRERAGSQRALIATALFALFPRNYSLLFWVASAQDLVAIPLIIAAVILWLRRRDLPALLCYLVSLGFKETAIVCPALFLLADLTLQKDFRIRRYIPIVLLTACYGAYVVLSGARDVTRSDGIYGLSILGAAMAEVREVANLALPFHAAFGLRELSRADWLIAAVVIAAAAFLAVRAPNRGLALFGAGWVLIALAPTSVFARTVNSDHYLMFPLVGVVILIAAVIERREAVAAIAAMAFGVAGYLQLVEYRQKWQADSERVAAFEREIHAKVHFPVRRITLINLTHSGLSTAVRGAMIEAGIPATLPVRYNFANVSDEKQRSLLNLLRSCSGAGSADETFLYKQGDLVDISGACATGLVDADLRTRPYDWH